MVNSLRIEWHTKTDIKKMSEWDLYGAAKFVNEDLTNPKIKGETTIQKLRRQRTWINEEIYKRRK